MFFGIMPPPPGFDPDDWARSVIPANAPADAIGTPVNRARALAYCLGVCGLNRREICALFSFGGAYSISELLRFDDKEWKAIFERISKAASNENTPRGMIITGAKQQNAIEGLRHWTFRHYRENRLDEIDPGSFDADLCTTMLADYKHMIRLKKESENNSLDEPKPLKDMKHFTKWHKSLVNYIRSLIGSFGVSLYYVIRPELTAAEIAALPEEDQMLHRIRHSGPEYQEDSQRVFKLIYGLILSSHHTLMEWTKAYEGSQNGRGLYLAIVRNFGGPAMVSARKSAATNTLDTCFYHGQQRTLPWEEYTSKLSGAFEDLAAAGEAQTPTAMRSRLFLNNKYTSNSVFNSYLAITESDTVNYPDFTSCATRLGQVIADLINKKQFGNPRNASAVQDGGDDGNKRLRGGGNRQDSGSGDGKFIINGVDLTDLHRSFSPAEMTKLGRRGQAILFDQRRRFPKDGKHKGGGGGNGNGGNYRNNGNKRKRDDRRVSFAETDDDKDKDDDADGGAKQNDGNTRNGDKLGRHRQKEKKKQQE